jgi:hypothetical protein
LAELGKLLFDCFVNELLDVILVGGSLDVYLSIGLCSLAYGFLLACKIVGECCA